MSKRFILLICCLSGLCWPCLAGREPAVTGYRVGTAVSDITPPVGYRLCGYFYERVSTGIHDPLHAKAIFLQEGKTQAALVFCDLIGVPRAVSDQAREKASQLTGIPRKHILIAATHSHTGPLYFDALRTYFHASTIEQAGEDPLESVDYPAVLTRRLVETIAQAKAAALATKLAAGIAQQPGLSFNRRFHMQDGTVVFNPGKLNTNIVHVAGPIDPDVGLLFIRDAVTNRPIGSLTVFAMHLDTRGGTQYSADYPFYLEDGLQKTFAPEFVSIFAAGTCGDINHIDVSTTRPQKGGEETLRIGAMLAKTAAKALPELMPFNEPSLAVRSIEIHAPLQEYSEEQLAHAREQMKDVGTSRLTFLEQVDAYKIVDLEEIRSRTGPLLPLEVQVFRLDRNTAIVGLPGEIFVELGLAIKTASPFKHTFVIELCNDDIAYVPTKRAFAEGSYETINSRVKPGAGEMLVEAAVKLLKELAR